MNEPQTPEQGKLQAFQNLWDVHREIRRAKGIDIDKLYAEIAASEAQKLSHPGAREDFVELCNLGCNQEVLAIITALVRLVPAIEGFWTFIVGDPARRHKLTNTLETAAPMLEEIFPHLTETADQEALRTELAKMGKLHPIDLAAEIRFYSGFLNLAESLAADTEARSIAEVLRYFLVGYVNRATGSFRDRNVSGLLGELVGPQDYDETAQRMWRHRNYSRLDSHFSKFTDIALHIGVVIDRSRP